MARIQSIPLNFKAGADIAQYQALTVGANDGEVVPTSAANQFIVGFARTDAKSGSDVGVLTDGVAMAIANAAVTRGHAISSAGAAGRVGGAAYAAATDTRAIALDAAGAAGDVFRVLLA